MFSVAALFSVNHVKLHDGDNSLTLVTTEGIIELPKDGVSDEYRLQEAVANKTRGGKGMVSIHPVKRVKDSPPVDELVFKEAWDARTPSYTHSIWGGSFQTTAIDHDDDEIGYTRLDLRPVPHYYNVLLNNRERRDFALVNPDLSYIECSGPCMPKKHFHGVHGFYEGAKVDGVPCAPPLSLVPAWGRLQRFFPPRAMRPVVPSVPPHSASEIDATSRDPSMFPLPMPFNEYGACVLAETINQRRPWSDIQRIFREPMAATWTVLTSRYTSLRLKAFEELKAKMAPMFRGEGTPYAEVIQCAWDLDQRPDKAIAVEFVHWLAAEDQEIRQTPEGNLAA